VNSQFHAGTEASNLSACTYEYTNKVILLPIFEFSRVSSPTRER